MPEFHSKKQIPCLVSECKLVFRGDALNRHYRGFVGFDKKGNPFVPNSCEFKKLKKCQQEHTRFF